jgi:hypothetical protein
VPNEELSLVFFGVYFLFLIAVVAGWIRIAKTTGIIIAAVTAFGTLVSIVFNYSVLIQSLGVIALIWISATLFKGRGQDA